MNGYPHMCRDGHAEIGHRDSEHEQCPVCRAYGALDFLGRTIGDDAHAVTFQTMGQYRSALLALLDALNESLDGR